MIPKNIVGLLCCVALAFGQDAQPYKSTGDSLKGGFWGPSGFFIHNSVSFGVSSAGGSSLESQGLYSTMLTYQFSQPITLNLDFGFPLFSTFPAGRNLNAQNITSAEYFRNMPIDFSMAWKPSDNTSLMLILHHGPESYYDSPFPVSRGAGAAASGALGIGH